MRKVMRQVGVPDTRQRSHLAGGLVADANRVMSTPRPIAALRVTMSRKYALSRVGAVYSPMLGIGVAGA